MELVANFFNLLITVLSVAVMGRFLMSWIVVFGWLPPGSNDSISVILRQVTDPILVPLSRIIPPLGAIDITPMVALILLGVMRNVVNSAL